MSWAHMIKSNCRVCNKEAYFRCDSDGNISEMGPDGYPLKGRCGECYDIWFYNEFNNGVNPNRRKYDND
jgi:hypothetical protein